MPRVWTVAEIKKAEASDPVHSFKGTVVTLGKEITGTGKGDKPWSFRMVKLQDPGGEQIEAKFWNSEERVGNDWKGKPIVIVAKQTNKGWRGCFTEDHEYQGRTTRQLTVDKDAEIIVGNVAQQHAAEGNGKRQPRDPEAEPGERQRGAKGGEAQEPQRDAAEIEDPVKALKRARIIAARAANAYLIALDTAVYVGSQFELKHDIEMEADQFRVLTSSIFIHLVDSFIITNLPAKPMWDVLGEPSPEQVRNEREKKTKGKK
jgi:hypothetical protein